MSLDKLKRQKPYKFLCVTVLLVHVIVLERASQRTMSHIIDRNRIGLGNNGYTIFRLKGEICFHISLRNLRVMI